MMRHPPFPCLSRSRRDARWAGAAVAAAAAVALLMPFAASAEKADRNKPMEVVADRTGTVDFVSQISRFNGNVVVTQGTMTIHADRVEVRETPDGYKAGT